MRNILDDNIEIKSIKVNEIAEYLISEDIVYTEEEVAPGDMRGNRLSTDKLGKVKNDISGLLDGKKQSNVLLIKKRTKAAVYVPELIIYQPDDNFKGAANHVIMLRKSCAFRDVPILVASTIPQQEKASSLISYGATNILIFPSPSEKVRRAIDMAMAPVGTNIPIVTKLINPFISATLDLMGTMAGLAASKKEVFLKRNYRLFGDVSGIMTFSGNIEGAVVVSFDEDLARKIIGKILGAQPKSLSQSDIKEGVGEIVNIISGNAKAALANTEYQHQITLPTVVTGCGHEINHPQNAPCIVVIFEASQKLFAVQVSMILKA